MRKRWLVAVGLLGFASFSAAQCPADIPEIPYEVIGWHPHKTDAYTQGLYFDGDQLIESIGRYGDSALRRTSKSGEVLQEQKIAAQYFAEGITPVGNEIWQLTWKAGELLIYDEVKLNLKRQISYKGQGWGLTHDEAQLYMSDGSDQLQIRHKKDFRLIHRLAVRAGRRAIQNLNELEFAQGQLYANIWFSEKIVRINPQNGCVSAWLDLSDLWPAHQRPHRANVLNGIAYEKQSGHFWITGKLWPRMYEIRLLSASNAKNQLKQ